jgi:hypothetical protein
MLVEEFMPGAEVALEGLVSGGRLITLALFDKPDPLEGPYFEETIYVTPSRHPEGLQRAIEAETARAVTALGLTNGPIHAELRLPAAGPMVLEIAPRSIGGLCSLALRFGQDESLERLLLRHALDGVDPPARERLAAGVMMIPIPRGGRLERVEGLDSARTVPCIEDIRISVTSGDELVPLPEGHRYLGFIFARAERPEAVDLALREAHRRLTFDIQPLTSGT